MTYKILENNTVLLSQPILIETFGRSTAQLISQIHYWTSKQQGVVKNGVRWIYSTAEELAKQICISQRQVERLIQKLKTAGVLKIEHFNKYARTNYYAIDYDRLNSMITIENEADKMSVSHRQNVGIYNTKITNKDLNNKSEETLISNQQVEQVIDFKKDNLEELDFVKLEIPTESQEKSSNLFKTIKKSTSIQDMLDFWNKNFPRSEAKLSKDMSRNLMGAFIHRFEKNMEKWQHYCAKIASSPYLLGENFVLTINWALKFSTIDRILNGEFGVKEIVFTPSEESLEKKALEHIDGVGESVSCKETRCLLLKKLGAATYISWFTKVEFIEQEGRVIFKAESQFVEDYITQKFGSLFYASK